MREIILIVHTSLDGFVANEKGGFDDFEPGEDNLSFVTEISKEADTILAGRLPMKCWMVMALCRKKSGTTKAEITYSDWYIQQNKIVISQTKNIPIKDTIVLQEGFIQKIEQIKKEKGKSIVVFGSPSITAQLMEHDLINIYWVFTYPVIFGKGIPLFQRMDKKRKLKLLHTRQFANDELALKYSMVN